MSKTVTINQDKLLMLKETVASDSNIASHNDYCSELTEAAPEVDEYEIGDEGSNPPVGGNFYHVNEAYNVSVRGDLDSINTIEFIPHENAREEGYEDDEIEDFEPYYEIDAMDMDGNTILCADLTVEELFDYFPQSIINDIIEKDKSNATRLSNPSINQYRIEDILYRDTTPSDVDNVEEVNRIAKKIQTGGPSAYLLTDGDIIYFHDHIYVNNIDGITPDKFIALGNIRLSNGGFELIKEPTRQQMYELKQWIRQQDGGIYVDFCEESHQTYPRTLFSTKYGSPNAERIVNDIYYYFEEGIKPQNNFYESKDKEKVLENFDFEVDSSEIDLSSFKKKHELVPNIWNPDGTLNSRVRLKLLDIADDFWEYVNLTWVKPSGIILTGSICNFNWSQYSDIDLHLIVDFDEIDEKTEFVRDYLDTKKNEWNNEHSGLQIMGYPVELYVQNLGEMPESNGIYDLEENDWVREPNPDDIKSIGLNKFSIKEKAAKIMTIIDDMYDALASTDDSHKIEQMGDDASYLWKKVKEMRKSSLEKNGESGSGNIVYKILRRSGYLDRLWKLSNVVYDKTNSITESKSEKKKYTVYINDKKDETFSDMNWKRKPKVGKGFYYGGAVFKIKKVTDDSIYAIEENRLNDKPLLKEYLEKDNNLPLYKYFKWASTASSCEKARDLAYSCSYYINEYIRKIYYRYSEFENLLNDGEFDYEDESLVEMFLNMLEENNLCDHFVSEMQNIVDYYELPSWCTMDFNRIVKNEWCIHFGSDSESIAKEGFTGGTPEIEHLAYTNAGAQKSSAGYDFAFLINDRSVDYNGYGNEAVIFRTSGVEIYHYGDNQNQVVFWGPNVKSFIPIHQDNGDWVVYGQNGQVLVRCGRPSEIALWATENLPQYRKQIMTGKNGYIPKMGRWNTETNKYERVPYPIYRNESVKKYITLLKENLINEEVVADGNSEHNPYKKRWEAERKALKDFICNFGKVMTSKENGKTYKVYYDKTLSQLIGYNYCICLQWDAVNLKPKSVLYIRALDKFTDKMFQANFDARGRDNLYNTADDLSYQTQ